MQENQLKAAYFYISPQNECDTKNGIPDDTRSGQSTTLTLKRSCIPDRWQLETDSAVDTVWDAEVKLPTDFCAAYFRLMEVIADRFPSIIPHSHVWGLGRQLWDSGRRTYGCRSLSILILGPPAVGKTSVAYKVAEKFGLLYVNPGDLLSVEVNISPSVTRQSPEVFSADAQCDWACRSGEGRYWESRQNSFWMPVMFFQIRS